MDNGKKVLRDKHFTLYVVKLAMFQPTNKLMGYLNVILQTIETVTCINMYNTCVPHHVDDDDDMKSILAEQSKCTGQLNFTTSEHLASSN